MKFCLLAWEQKHLCIFNFLVFGLKNSLHMLSNTLYIFDSFIWIIHMNLCLWFLTFLQIWLEFEILLSNCSHHFFLLFQFFLFFFEPIFGSVIHACIFCLISLCTHHWWPSMRWIPLTLCWCWSFFYKCVFQYSISSSLLDIWLECALCFFLLFSFSQNLLSFHLKLLLFLHVVSI